MKSPEMNVVPRSLAVIVATGSVALICNALNDDPSAQALTQEKCNFIHFQVENDGIAGPDELTGVIQDYAADEYTKSVDQPNPNDIDILHWNTTQEISEGIGTGDIPMPARDGNTYYVCITPGNPEHISVNYTQEV